MTMKKIALINDLSGFGKCSLTAAIPVISVLGVQACPLPTAILSAQTGFDSYFYDDYTNKMNCFTNEWEKLCVHFEGIYSGYLGSAEQMHNVLYFLEKFHTHDTLYLADPVMGDNGEPIRIFTQKLLDSMKELTKHAGVITPNLTELCLLADADYTQLTGRSSSPDYTIYIEETARGIMQKAYGRQTVIVTGIIRHITANTGTQAFMGNLAVTPDSAFYFEKPYTGKSFSGTGDLTASVIAGCMVQGLNVETALQKAVNFLQPAIEEASCLNIEGVHGIPFEKYLNLLL